MTPSPSEAALVAIARSYERALEGLLSGDDLDRILDGIADVDDLLEQAGPPQHDDAAAAAARDRARAAFQALVKAIENERGEVEAVLARQRRGERGLANPAGDGGAEAPGAPDAREVWDPWDPCAEPYL